MLRHVTKLTEDASASQVIQEAASKAIDSKAVATAVAAGTAALGLSDIQSIAQLFATLAAGILSVVLFVKHGYDFYQAVKKANNEKVKTDKQLEEDA